MIEAHFNGQQTLEFKILKDSEYWELGCSCGNVYKYENWFSFKKVYKKCCKRGYYECHTCRNLGRKHTKEAKRNMSIAAKNRNISVEQEEYRKRKISESKKIWWASLTNEEKKELGNKISNGKVGYKRSPETKRKLRKARIRQREIAVNNGNQLHPSYNLDAIPILEQFAEENDLNLMHAENGGEYYIEELGYWVDGYDPEKNVVVEYYEKFHERQKERDDRRKQEIVEYLDCEFIILEEY